MRTVFHIRGKKSRDFAEKPTWKHGALNLPSVLLNDPFLQYPAPNWFLLNWTFSRFSQLMSTYTSQARKNWPRNSSNYFEASNELRRQYVDFII